MKAQIKDSAGTVKQPEEMHRPSRWTSLIVLPVMLSFLFVTGCTPPHNAPYQSFHSELEYLKSANSTGPAGDPQIIFLLMAQYVNANQQEEGIEFFTSFLDRYESRLSPPQKALYLAALGLLRASHADRVPLLKRIGWVNGTIEMLESARKLSNNEIFVIRWITGVVYAQLPDSFRKRDAAVEELKWCMENIAKAPDRGWLREVYYHLALLYHKTNDDRQAKEFLALSGYKTFDKQIILTTPFAVNARKGFTFSSRRAKEIVPGKVFALSGFEFTEFYFVVSEDNQELIAIDAGTRPDSAQAVYDYLKNRFPNLPPLTTVFVTHAHWDHIGGHRYFRRLSPHAKFYARENYQRELELSINAPFSFSYFFGTEFNMEFIDGFKPDVTIAERTKITVGGTQCELIPITGGETQDGMMIYLPRHSILFAGDFIMPYIGAPFLEEGSIPGLFQTIDLIVTLHPDYLLQGHEPLTRVFNSPELLANLKRHLEWLQHETLKSIRGGKDRAAIHHQNLIPPFLSQHPEVQVPYLLLRENVINRLFDQNVGYWQSDLQGMDHLSQREFGLLLTHYLELSERQLANAIESMVNNGDHELAARTVLWALTQYLNSERLTGLKKMAFLKLIEKYQAFSPFKFIIYSEMINHETPQLE